MAEDGKMTLYEALGGEDSIRRLCDRFYDFMEELPEARDVLALHPKDLSESRDKFYWFLDFKRNISMSFI